MPDERNKGAGFLILRLFLVQFWLLQFFGKLRDQESGTIALRNLGFWARSQTAWFAKTTPLPAWAVLPYVTLVPYAELAIGLLLLVGFRMRATLIAAGLLLVSLDVGMMLQLKHEVVGNNTIFLLAVLLALIWEPFGRRWSLDK